MLRRLTLWTAALAGSAASVLGAAGESPPVRMQVVVIPVREAVAEPLHYIIRRGLKQAIENKADVVVLDMKTPGGALDTTFEIMEALAKFPGQTITFVNNEAISAGAFISATTNEIWFAPTGVIGAAAPVLATGGEIDESMRQKIVSYLKARVRASSEGRGLRGQVISAMIDADYELKVGERVLKGKGELLTLTASEASEKFGDPPQPLLAAGIAGSVDELLASKYGPGGFATTVLEVTWSENLAVWLNSMSPLLIGLGLLALFVEFKTPGFGFFGVAGILLLGTVFLSGFVSGLSGHEPILVFVAGMVLLAVEIFFFPGIAVLAIAGLMLMLGSLVWSMADLWPNEPLTFSGGWLVQPVTDVGLGVLIAGVLGLVLIRFMPRGWIWDRLVIQGTSGAAAVPVAVAGSLVGRRGVAATALRPGGHVEIDGRRLEARVEVGAIEAGDRVVVLRQTGFGVIVGKDTA